MKKQKIENRIKKIGTLLLAFSLCLGLGVQAADETKAYSWYVQRNTSHMQPQPDAAQARFTAHGLYYVDRAHRTEADEKVLYLTFDAGYENGNIAKILDVLHEEKVSAAFFVLKNILLKEHTLVEKMQQDDHLICNHTMRHKDMTTMQEEEFCRELTGLAELYEQQYGKSMARYYRPPEGKYNENNLRWAQKLGYKTIFWSFAYADWDNDKQPDPAAAKKKVLDNTHNGAVILLHPTSGTNAAILGDLIREWKKEGYRFGTLDELVQA